MLFYHERLVIPVINTFLHIPTGLIHLLKESWTKALERGREDLPI
jgi:hypothetical protein